MRNPLSLFWVSVLMALSAHTLADSRTVESKPLSPTMNNQRLAELIKRIDNKVEGSQGYCKFSVEAPVIQVITDEKADRMRIIVPIIKSEEVDGSQLYRLL